MWITSYQSFWDSFWAGLFSGTIYSIIVGLIVGLILWFFQKYHEKNKREQEIEKEVNVFLQQLKIHLQSSTAGILSDDPSKFIPSNLDKSINFIMNKPLDIWSSNLKDKYQDEIQMLMEIVNLYLTFRKNASIIEPAINFQLLKEFDQLNYIYYIAPTYGIINNYDIDTLKVYRQIPSLTDDRIDKIQLILNESEIKTLTTNYQQNRRKFLDKFNEFSRLIGIDSDEPDC